MILHILLQIAQDPESAGHLLETIGTGAAGAAAVGGILSFFIKRLIARLDRIDIILTGEGIENPGLVTKVLTGEKDDKTLKDRFDAFEEKFDKHLDTHQGIEAKVDQKLRDFEIRILKEIRNNRK